MTRADNASALYNFLSEIFSIKTGYIFNRAVKMPGKHNHIIIMFVGYINRFPISILE